MMPPWRRLGRSTPPTTGTAQVSLAWGREGDVAYEVDATAEPLQQDETDKTAAHAVDAEH
jgi:hypothetical protein